MEFKEIPTRQEMHNIINKLEDDLSKNEDSFIEAMAMKNDRIRELIDEKVEIEKYYIEKNTRSFLTGSISSLLMFFAFRFIYRWCFE